MNYAAPYISGNSLIHSLDPRTKLIITIFIVSFTLLADNFTSLAILIFLLSLMMTLSQIRPLYIFTPLRASIWLLLFTFLIYLVSSPEYSLTHRLYAGILFTSRLIVLVLFISVLSLTTSPLDLCSGLEYLLSPLKRIKFPLGEVILIIHLSLRFIPTLFQELERIIKALSTRGINFKKGNILKQLKCLIPVMLVLFKNSFHRADELALVLEARGYQISQNRTKLKELRMTLKDYLCLLIVGIMLVVFWWVK